MILTVRRHRLCRMRPFDYFQTPSGKASLLRERQMRRFTATVFQDPQSKNIRLNDAIAFQQTIATEMKSRRAYRGSVALKLEFFNLSKTPPAIHSLPKNYLDLLGKVRPDAKLRRKFLLYKDDRQVKSLIVRYHLWSMFQKPAIWLTAEPMRDLLDDLDLVGTLPNRSPYVEDNNQLFPSEDSDSGDKYEELVEYERSKDSYRKILSEQAFQAGLNMMRMDVQQRRLKQTDVMICRWLVSDLARRKVPLTVPEGAMIETIRNTTRNIMMSNPLTIELFHAPHRTGDNERFKEKLRSELESFKAKNRAMFPLLSLLNVTIMMVPPEGGGKDVDNLARMVIPAVHEIWAPPSDISYAFQVDGTGDANLDALWKRERDALPKEPRYSVTEYRVFELPRRGGDDKDGFVRLAVGDGFTPVRFREDIDDFLDRWANSLS